MQSDAHMCPITAPASRIFGSHCAGGRGRRPLGWGVPLWHQKYKKKGRVRSLLRIEFFEWHSFDLAPSARKDAGSRPAHACARPCGHPAAAAAGSRARVPLFAPRTAEEKVTKFWSRNQATLRSHVPHPAAAAARLSAGGPRAGRRARWQRRGARVHGASVRAPAC